MPFNDSIFQLRGKYGQVFSSLAGECPDAEDGLDQVAEEKSADEPGFDTKDQKFTKKHKSLGVSVTLQDNDMMKAPGTSKKVYRIKYTLNLLPGAVVQESNG